MNYRETKFAQAQRQHHKPLRTHSESIAKWILAIAMALGLVLAAADWWLS